MAINHHLDTTGRAAKIGANAESLFSLNSATRGYKVTQASKKQEIREHWDFLLEKDGKSFKVEVKSKKDFFIFSGGKLTNDFILVEFVGVAGYAGWLYGESDLLAVEREDGFYLIPTKTLREVSERLCKKTWVDNKKNMLYKTYGRKDRQDEVSAILLSDIIATKNFQFWKK